MSHEIYRNAKFRIFWQIDKDSEFSFLMKFIDKFKVVNPSKISLKY